MGDKKILNDCFGVKECYIVDNRLSEFNPLIKKLEYFNGKKTDEYTVLLTNANPDSYESVREGLTKFFVKRISLIFLKKIWKVFSNGLRHHVANTVMDLYVIIDL